jgi:hypothetical protein
LGASGIYTYSYKWKSVIDQKINSTHIVDGKFDLLFAGFFITRIPVNEIYISSLGAQFCFSGCAGIFLKIREDYRTSLTNKRFHTSATNTLSATGDNCFFYLVIHA